VNQPQKTEQPSSIYTEGGAYIAGDMNTGGGSFIGRDFIQHITQFFIGDSEAQRDLRNHRAMLQLVRNTWIKGVLEQSLHGAALLELGKEYRPEAVERSRPQPGWRPGAIAPPHPPARVRRVRRRAKAAAQIPHRGHTRGLRRRLVPP
jgi:hypothetical protein